MRNNTKTQDIVVMYLEKHLTLRQIGAEIGMSPTAVLKRLRTAGVDTKQGTAPVVVCSFCGKEFVTNRCRVKKGAKYCSVECYGLAITSPVSFRWRHGMRLARAVVAQHYNLLPQHVVHHKDGDNRNNDRANLCVFSSQADHASFHRGGDAKPVWDGSRVK